MRTVVIIPSRMGSSRYPGKPLARILDLPMIEHVRRRALLCRDVDEVVVATCDDEIREVVQSHGGRVIMTSDRHQRCTDRIAEAAAHIEADIVVNVQGDEPCVFPQCVSDVARPVGEGEDCRCSTLIYPVATYEELANPNYVKVVLSQSGRVLYFCRNVIPSRREGQSPKLYKQSGIMAYRKDFLLEFSSWPQTPLERVESCDMLRILEHDVPVRGVVTPYETPGVDVPEDIRAVEELIGSDAQQKAFYEQIVRMSPASGA